MQRIGVLSPDRTAVDEPNWAAFVTEMSRRGWVEGRNVIFEKRFGDISQPERIDALALELAALDVDVIYVRAGTRSALAAKKATRTIPIVFRSSADPVGLGLVESLPHPGGNLTGISILALDIDPKAMQFLAEATGKLTRFAYIEPSDNRLQPFFPMWAAVMTAAAERLGTKLEFVDLDSDREIAPTLQRLVDQGFNGAMCESTRQFKLDASEVSSLFIKYRLPTIGDARAGFLLHYNVPAASLDQTAAAYVDRILRGAKPSALPVQQASKFELVINLKTAKALNLSVPRSLLERADEILR